MSRLNSISHRLAERLGRIRAVAGRVPTHVTARVVLLVVCLLEESTATVACAVATSLGGLPLIRALVARRGSHEPCKVPVQSMRMRRRPLRHR